MTSNRSRPIWITFVAIHIVFTFVLGLIGVPNLAIGPSDNAAVRWTLTAIAAVGVALMILGLIAQRSRLVSGSRVFVVGLLPSLISPTGLIVLGSGAWTANLVFSKETFDLAPDAAGDEHPEARGKGKEMTTSTFEMRWWHTAAGFIAVGMVFLGIGNLLGEDGGPLYGKIVAVAVAVAESIEAQFCVGGTPSVFEFTVVRRGPSVNTTHETIAIIADSLWTKVPGAGEGSSEYISVQYGFDADVGPLILRTNSGVTRFLDGGAPPDRWGSGSGIGDLSAVEVSAGIWDVTFSGAVGSSLDAFESGDMVRQTATAVFGVFSRSIPISISKTPRSPSALRRRRPPRRKRPPPLLR